MNSYEEWKHTYGWTETVTVMFIISVYQCMGGGATHLILASACCICWLPTCVMNMDPRKYVLHVYSSPYNMYGRPSLSLTSQLFVNTLRALRLSRKNCRSQFLWILLSRCKNKQIYIFTCIWNIYIMLLVMSFFCGVEALINVFMFGDHGHRRLWTEPHESYNVHLFYLDGSVVSGCRLVDKGILICHGRQVDH